MELSLQKLQRNSRRFKVACVPLMFALVLPSAQAKEAKDKDLAEYGKEAARFINVTGTVKDSKGEPLPGVTVTIKGTKTSTATDINGVFRLNLPNGNETLVFSFLGFQSKEVKSTGNSNLNVVLEESTSSLNEVVVVGYGSQKKETTTHAIETINMDAVNDIPVASLAAALRGQMAGLSVQGGQSRPNANASIQIRQPRLYSKDGGTLSPLYVIDDIIRTEDEFNNLDQSEIESITVLKDAAAAIYGVNGNQGAILVKTKRGKIGAPIFSYSGSVGLTDAAMLPKMMSGYDQARYLNTYNFTDGKAITDQSIYSPDELEYFKNNNYDWLDMAWKTSMINRHTVNASGGTDKATYYAGITYNVQDANLENVFKDRWTYRASTNVKIGKNIKADFSVSGNVGTSKQYWLKQGGESVEKDVLALLQTPQFNPPYINGLPVLLTSGTSANTENFHFFEVQKSGDYTQSKATGLNVNMNLAYDVPFIKGLTLKGTYSNNKNNSFGKQYGTAYNVYRFSMLGDHRHIYGGDVTGSVQLKNGYMLRFNPTMDEGYQINAQASYARSFGKHNISAMAMVEQRESYADGVATYIENPILGGEDNMAYFTGTSVMQSQSESENGYLSYVGRFQYNYEEKYLFEATFRADASTKFAPENRWGYFPSFSAGWIISKESFFRDNVSFIDFLKIRGAIGFVGADRTRPFQWYTRYRKQTQRSAVFGGDAARGIIFNQNGIANRDATWDNVTKTSLGVEARFLKDRLTFGADYYHDHNYNMLTQLTSSISLLVGEQLPSENYSTINTFGTEFSLGWRDKVGKDWSYNINTFFNWYDDKPIKIDQAASSIGTMLDKTNRSTDMGVYGYKYAGFFRTQDEVDAFLADHPGFTIFGRTPAPGMLYYEDISGARTGGDLTQPDGKIDENDQTYLTKKESNHFGIGLNFNISYRALSLGITSGINWGGQSYVEGDARARATSTVNKPAFWADHWSVETPNAKYPNPYYYQQNSVLSSFWFRNATTINISNLNLSYKLPDKVSKKVGVNSTRVYVVSTNPFNVYNPFKDYKYYSGSFNVYPVVRTVSFGLNIGF
ncbi:TonB-dependent receptor plug [Pseudopedobacter saltans DSM 12145]|uniref:TonB-dependent receptor plug n=2 Tax=Pseudopedobacter saltans TaxID=151895 RepID=F0S4D1_PSESL|nr:TonB-dependent receptor plug [Pseudopedobacter saltans DSM 12145]